MAYAFNPIADPMGFLFFMFLGGIGEDTIGTLLKLSILSSVIAFPFLLLGQRVYGWLGKNMKSAHLIVLFIASFVTMFLSLIIVRLWYVLFGSRFLSIGLTDFVLGFAIAGIIAFLLAVLGDFLGHKLHQKWEVPDRLALYVIDVVVCLVFFIFVSIAYMLV